MQTLSFPRETGKGAVEVGQGREDAVSGKVSRKVTSAWFIRGPLERKLPLEFVQIQTMDLGFIFWYKSIIG